jgi:hypothetical protein
MAPGSFAALNVPAPSPGLQDAYARLQHCVQAQGLIQQSCGSFILLAELLQMCHGKERFCFSASVGCTLRLHACSTELWPCLRPLSQSKRADALLKEHKVRVQWPQLAPDTSLRR